MSTTPTTSAQSGAQLSGVSWLTDLIKTGASAYVAVETVKAEKRTAGSVTTQTTPRVEPATTSMLATPEGKRTAIIAGALVGLLVLLLVIRRK